MPEFILVSQCRMKSRSACYSPLVAEGSGGFAIGVEDTTMRVL